MADWAAQRGATEIEGEFIPTAKNAPAADFYDRHGFKQVNGNEDQAAASGTSTWRPPFASRLHNGRTRKRIEPAHAN